MNKDSMPLVLIVDDNTENLKILGNYLRNEGVDIAIATNGQKAVSIAQNKLPDLILLDIMMPELDGFWVCEQLKSNTLTKDIPVIFLTAKISTEDILKAFSLGAVDYITKPFNSAELSARVSTHLKIRKYMLQIEQNNAELEVLNKEKNEFLGIAAHDLKNPIYSISMLAKMIRDESMLTKEEIAEFSTDIVNVANRMLEIISNLLDINAMEQGRIKIELEPVDLSELLTEIKYFYREKANRKGIELIAENRATNPIVRIDRNASLQVLDNLVSNAIKFSPVEKKVFITLSETKETATIEVKDQGPGLTDDDKTKLFGKFQRLSAQPTAEENSTGLGLSIVKKYVEAMNGKIWVESTFGKGASFFVEYNK